MRSTIPESERTNENIINEKNDLPVPIIKYEMYN